MATSVRFDLSSYAPLDSVRRIAVGRRFSRESAFYPFLSNPMYGHTLTQHVGLRRSLLYRVLVPRGKEPVVRQSRIRSWHGIRRVLRITNGVARRWLARSCAAMCHRSYLGLGAMGRFIKVICTISVNLLRFTLLGLPSEKVTLYFEPRCGQWHRKKG